MSKTDIQEMFECAVHIGHRTHKWNPKMKKYIYTEKNGIHIIDLEKTSVLLVKALNFLSKSAAEGKTILFVSTKPQSINLLQEAAKSCSMPYVIAKWIPGLLTNFSTIKTRIKYLSDLKEQKASGELDKYTKKEAANLKKTMDKLQISLGGVQDLKQKPDVLFVLDVLRDKIVVQEAKKLGIPVVGIVDTNSDPTTVDFPIPGNDDALKSLEFFTNCVTEAVRGTGKTKQ